MLFRSKVGDGSIVFQTAIGGTFGHAKRKFMKSEPTIKNQRTSVGAVRYQIRKMLPEKLRWWILREAVPAVVNLTAKIVQGIDPIFDDDSDFRAIYDRIADRCLIDRKKAYVLYNICRNLRGREGAIAELGVYRGATAKLILDVVGDEMDFYGFDTFEGLPDTNGTLDPFWRKGDLSDTSLENVRQFIARDKASLIKGVFPGSASQVPDLVRFAFVHVDCDIYQTTADACSYFYPRMRPGGMILMDDYGYLSCPGVRQAVDAFFADKLEKPIFIPSGQALIVKV